MDVLAPNNAARQYLKDYNGTYVSEMEASLVAMAFIHGAEWAIKTLKEERKAKKKKKKSK